MKHNHVISISWEKNFKLKDISAIFTAFTISSRRSNDGKNGVHLTLSQTTILHASKLNEFAEDNSEFDENGKKLSKRVRNTVGKGEIAHYEQFLLFPQCFQKTCTADM